MKVFAQCVAGQMLRADHGCRAAVGRMDIEDAEMTGKRKRVVKVEPKAKAMLLTLKRGVISVCSVVVTVAVTEVVKHIIARYF